MQNSFKQKLHKYLREKVQQLERFTDKAWYSLLIGFLAMIDTFVIVIPTDGILISSTMLKPKRWLLYAVAITIGSSLGALLFGYVLEVYGLPLVLDIYPSLTTGNMWLWMENFFNQYGLIIVFIIAAMPVVQNPSIILACMADISLTHIFLVIFAGRFLKYLIMGYISSHAPRLLGRLWGVQDELDEVGIKIT
jgi:membrane protein YqaA with SNARE-associated domain